MVRYYISCYAHLSLTRRSTNIEATACLNIRLGRPMLLSNSLCSWYIHKWNIYMYISVTIDAFNANGTVVYPTWRRRRKSTYKGVPGIHIMHLHQKEPWSLPPNHALTYIIIINIFWVENTLYQLTTFKRIMLMAFVTFLYARAFVLVLHRRQSAFEIQVHLCKMKYK